MKKGSHFTPEHCQRISQTRLKLYKEGKLPTFKGMDAPWALPLGTKRKVEARGYFYYRIKVTPSGRWPWEHRLIAEHNLGRTLSHNEIVHHVNGDTLDNRPENIVVVTRATHNKIHGRVHPLRFNNS